MTEGSIEGLVEHYRTTNPTPGVRMITVFGSRARGDASASSDWDIGVLGDPGFDADSLRAQLAARLATDQIDLVDLDRASGQLRYRVARDGKAVFVRDDGEWNRFWTEAVSFWCDAGPVLQRAYAGLLQELGP